MQPVDDHTLRELQIISDQYKERSILNFFDKTKSLGGRDMLKSMIRKPRQSLTEILSVQELLKTISQNTDSWQVNVSRAYVAAAENYYASNIAHTMSQDAIQHWFETLIFSLRNPTEFYHIQSGLAATFRVLKALQEMISRLKEHEITDEVKDDVWNQGSHWKKQENSLWKKQVCRNY